MRTITQQSNPENPLIRKIGVQTITAALAVATVLLCAATAANAQDQGFKIGARLGYSMQMVNFGNIDTDMGMLGFSGGVAFSIPAGPVVIAPEVAFMYRENWRENGSNGSFLSQTEMAVSVPVLVKFFPTQGLYLQAGVQADIPIAPEICFEGNGRSRCDAMDGKDSPSERAAIDLGIPVGIGYMIMPNIGVDFRYVIGLMAYSEFDDRKEDPLNSMSLGVTYFF